jgi:CMP/dCMP kinase
VTANEPKPETNHPTSKRAGGMPRTIAIDGPAGAGKSTIGRMLAEKLGYVFLDTGAMYRAVALAALRQGISPSNEEVLAQLADELPIHIDKPKPGETDGRSYTVMIDHEDVTWEIRKSSVESVVSAVASHPEVRSALVRQQRRMARRGPVVMVGRDITTEVLPDADLKVYLDASLQERARRRFVELHERGNSLTFNQVESEIAHRDRQDMNREAGALRRAPDAVLLDSDGLSREETLEALLKIARDWKAHQK